MSRDVLYYGYEPSCEKAGLPAKIKQAVNSDSNVTTVDNLPERGYTAFKHSVIEEIEQCPGGTKHIVPLSAGLDSRAILAVLLELPTIDPNSITTVTFGVPGTWDFEIGSRIAEDCGIENIRIDLSSKKIDWSEDTLRKHAETIGCPGRIFESYINNYVLRDVAGRSNAVVWSGFLGGPTAGSHLRETPSKSWEAAKAYFIESNCFTTELVDESYDASRSLPDEPYIARKKMTYEEQLDFAHRQQCFIRPILIQDQYDYATPFFQREWLEFALNLPAKRRENRSLFIDIFSTMYPAIFSIPTDAKHGLPPTARKITWKAKLAKLYLTKTYAELLGKEYVYPGTNYLNFSALMRKEGKFKRTVRSVITTYSNRNAGLGEKLWEEHQSGTDRSAELRAICTAELFES